LFDLLAAERAGQGGGGTQDTPNVPGVFNYLPPLPTDSGTAEFVDDLIKQIAGG
jgi:hypothetical protein